MPWKQRPYWKGPHCSADAEHNPDGLPWETAAWPPSPGPRPPLGIAEGDHPGHRHPSPRSGWPVSFLVDSIPEAGGRPILSPAQSPAHGPGPAAHSRPAGQWYFLQW